MKRLALFLILIAALVLCGCSAGTPVLTPTPLPTKDPNAFERFREGAKYGLRRGDTVIADAIWDSIIEYEIEGKKYFCVEFAGSSTSNNRSGLIDADGNMIIEPSYNFLFPIGEHYVIGSMHGSDLPSDVIDVSTGEVVYSPSLSVESIVDSYVIHCEFGAVKTYHIADLTTGQMLYTFPYESYQLESCNIPVYYPDWGFLIEFKPENGRAQDIFVRPNGEAIQSYSIQINPELELIAMYEDRGEILRDGYVNAYANHGVYTKDLVRIGDFTCQHIDTNSFFINTDGHYVKIADAISPVSQPGYVFFDATEKTYKEIPSAASVAGFSNGMAIIRNNENKYGYINDRGDIVYNYQFDDAVSFSNGRAVVVKNYKKVIIDKTGDDPEQVCQQARSLIETGDYAKAWQLLNAVSTYPDASALLATPEMHYGEKQMKYQPGALAVFGDYHGAITWIVLEQTNGQALLLSRDILDSQAYYSSAFSTEFNGWDSSFIKHWLNTTFMQEAFTPEQQEHLADAGIGKVFLISQSEAERYKDFFWNKPKYTAHTQSIFDARRASSSYYYSSLQNNWLLRNEDTNDILYTETGFVHKGEGNYYGIRPAIRVPLDVLP